MNLTPDHKPGGGGVGYYSAGRQFMSRVEKYGIRTRSEDKFESALDSSAAASTQHLLNVGRDGPA